ncbi:hypothetical protein SEA_JUSTBECAUSE_146 [Streptomyces phage JustBecause]|nr:hypothetical protein SEA_JUSTBECAUSE_146 [Streptomyces phage JustBecause]
MSLTTAVRSVFRSAAKKFPGAAEADIAVYAKLIYEAAATNLKSTYKDEEAIGAADKELAEAAERGEAWAENLRDSVLVNVVKPVVDKANEKGVDPVSALVLADFTEEQAREYVAALADRADDADADADADADEAGSDDDTTGSTDAVSYGYGSPVASH